MDDDAASPLTVIAVVAVATAVVVGVTVFLLADREASWAVQAAPPAEGVGFVVVSAPQGTSWSDVEVALLNAGGTDRAALYLERPTGDVEEGQLLLLGNDPPAGPYLLRILRDGRELARATVVV